MIYVEAIWHNVNMNQFDLEATCPEFKMQLAAEAKTGHGGSSNAGTSAVGMKPPTFDRSMS
jgi:hypothetical protein